MRAWAMGHLFSGASSLLCVPGPLPSPFFRLWWHWGSWTCAFVAGLNGEPALLLSHKR